MQKTQTGLWLSSTRKASPLQPQPQSVPQSSHVALSGVFTFVEGLFGGQVALITSNLEACYSAEFVTFWPKEGYHV